jgi:nucleotidyltransferase/DNA polymerase involved in DNA repair
MEHEKYEFVSERIMEGLEGMVDILEPSGIDEAFFDLTASTGGDFHKARQRAEAIKESVLKSERLTCSVGIGRSKVVAKLGSDTSKPGGLKVILPEDTESFLDPLEVDKLYGVGPKTSAELEKMGIRTVGQLARADHEELERRFGQKFADYLSAAASGNDGAPVVAGLEPTQYSRIITLKHDTRDPHETLEQLSQGIDYIHNKLVSSGKSFRTVSAIAILTDLSTKTKSKTFETPVDGAEVIRSASSDLFGQLSRSAVKDFRRAGIRVSGLSDAEDQTSLSEFLRLVS